MAKAILRTAKLKGGNLASSVAHLERSRETPNADHDRRDLNLVLRGGDEPLAAIKDRLATGVQKRRSNSVEAVELFIGTSPDWDGWDESSRSGELTEKAQAWVDQSLAWADDTFGSDNVVVAHLHRDELTPHLSVFVTPIDEKGSLNARQWTGGRKALSDMQTGYHSAVEGLGLERGMKGSRARHQDVGHYYAIMESGETPQVPAVDIDPKKLTEGAQGHAEREMEWNNDNQKESLQHLRIQARAGQAAHDRVQELQRTLAEKDAEMKRRLKAKGEAHEKTLAQKNATIKQLTEATKQMNLELQDLRGMGMNHMMAILQKHYPPDKATAFGREQAAALVAYRPDDRRQVAFNGKGERLRLTEKEYVRNSFDLAKWWIRDREGKQMTADKVQTALVRKMDQEDFGLLVRNEVANPRDNLEGTPPAGLDAIEKHKASQAALDDVTQRGQGAWGQMREALARKRAEREAQAKQRRSRSFDR